MLASVLQFRVLAAHPFLLCTWYVCFLVIVRNFQDIVDDIQQECSSHGTVMSVIVPRPGEADASRAVGELPIEQGH